MTANRDACPTCDSDRPEFRKVIWGKMTPYGYVKRHLPCGDPWHDKRDGAGKAPLAADDALVDEKSYSTNLPESLEKAIDECHAVACNNWEDENKDGRCERLRERLWHIAWDAVKKERDEKAFNFEGWVKAEERLMEAGKAGDDTQGWRPQGQSAAAGSIPAPEQGRHARQPSESRDSLRERVEREMRDIALEDWGGSLLLEDAVSVAVEMIQREHQISSVCIEGDCGRTAAYCEEHFTLAWDHNDHVAEKRAEAAEKGLDAHHQAMAVSPKRSCSHCTTVTDSKLAAALRECEEAICNCDALEKAAHGHLPRCAERLRVLARYGDLREKEGYARGRYDRSDSAGKYAADE